MNGLFTRGYALLIGVGESAYSPLSLPVTVKDTQAIYKVLINPDLCGYPDDNIKILNDNEATKNNILEGLQWLKEKAESDRDATIFIYYSGHGWLDKNNEKYYLIQHDIKPTKIAKSALSAEEFTEAIRQIQSQRLLVVIDSCHAAGMATSKNAEEELWDEFDDFQRQSPSKGLTSALSQGKGRVVFTSSDGEEKSWIMKDNSLSIYTFHFLEALQGAGNKAGDTVVKVSNLMNYLGETVPKTVQNLYDEKQTPHFDFDTDDFAISMLRGGKGLPDKGWDAVKPEAHQNIYKIADNLTQIAEKIVNVTEMNGGQIGDVYHGDVVNKNYQQNENQGNIYNAEEMRINQGKEVNQSQSILEGATISNSEVGEIRQIHTNVNQTHSGSGDNVAGDKNVTNN